MRLPESVQQEKNLYTAHVLQEAERALLRGMGQDPDKFCGFTLQGDTSFQEVPPGAVPGMVSGGYVFSFQGFIPRNVIDALDAPVSKSLIVEGQMSSARFDKTLGLPPVLRLVIKTQELARAVRRKVRAAIAGHGKPLSDADPCLSEDLDAMAAGNG